MLTDSKGLLELEKELVTANIDYLQSKFSLGFIYFVYSFMLLQILKCSLKKKKVIDKNSSVTINLSEHNIWNIFY